jgi:hypothetical protein
MNMSKNVEQKAADSALAYEPVDRATDFKMCKSGDVTHVTIMGETGALMRSFGTKDPDFLFGLIHQVANAGSKGEYPDELGFKFILAFIRDREPRDHIDAMLTAQAAATHVAVMRAANRLAHAESLQERDSAERIYNKLTRTFTMQVEALQRYRATTKEKAIVQLVPGSDGSLANIGNVTGPAPEIARKKPMRTRPVLSVARRPPTRSLANRTVRQLHRRHKE